jgi:hypothetical protein
VYRPKIFLVGEDRENLITLEETGYVEETVLQDYLVDYPDLLPGDQITPEDPRRWLLVAQEMGVPGEEEGGNRWSLDHLFLDQDGVPTFVECKRSTDTRARREVVAQMLDYAANGIEYWSMDRLRQAAAEASRSRGRSLDDEIAELLGGDELTIEQYWDAVEANLRAHRVRLVFVADSTPKELRRLVEFLNEEMRNVGVLAVEIKQFHREGGGGQTALVPRVVGLTEAAREKTSRPRGKNLTPEEFLDDCQPAGREFFQRLLNLARKRDDFINWGTSRFSVRAHLRESGQYATFGYGIPTAKHNKAIDEFQFYFGGMEPLTSEGQRSALRRELLAFGVFEEAGEKSLKAPLTENNLQLMNDIYDLILDRVDELLAPHQDEDETG